MSQKNLPVLILAALTVGLAGCDRQVSYSEDVEPVLKDYCANCHTPGSEGFSTSGFNIASYDTVIRGTSLGPVIVEGSAMSSTLYRVIAKQSAVEIHMPPTEAESLAQGRGKVLPDDKVALIGKWIDQGAKNN